MLAGKCDPGKGLLRKNYENTNMASFGPEHVDKAVDHAASLHCQGKMNPRDELIQGFTELTLGANVTKKSGKECEAAYEKVKRNAKVVKPKDDEDHMVIQASRDLYAFAPLCFARAGDCDRAWEVFQAHFPKERLEHVPDKSQHPSVIRSMFEAMVTKCKPKG